MQQWHGKLFAYEIFFYLRSRQAHSSLESHRTYATLQNNDKNKISDILISHSLPKQQFNFPQRGMSTC